MIAQCHICWQRIKPQEIFLDDDYFGWKTTVHLKCWLERYPSTRVKESSVINIREEGDMNSLQKAMGLQSLYTLHL